jgi:predicted MPP superfamily phosphohydrolase
MRVREGVRDAIVFSDAHLHGGDESLDKIKLLRDIIEKEKPAIVILNGDILDRWQAPWEASLDSQSWKVIHDMILKRKEDHLQTYYVKGNHDWTVQKKFVSDPKLCSYLELVVGGKRYLFIHGWQFDVIWSGIWYIPGISRLAFFIATKMPWMMSGIYHCLYKNHTPAKKKEKALGLCKKRQSAADTSAAMDAFSEWTLHIGVVHLRASKYAHDHKVKTIIGHTHGPSLFNGLMADDGDMLDSFTYLYISKDGVQLKQLLPSGTVVMPA